MLKLHLAQSCLFLVFLRSWWMTYPLVRSHLLLEFRRSGGRLSIPIEHTVLETNNSMTVVCKTGKMLLPPPTKEKTNKPSFQSRFSWAESRHLGTWPSPPQRTCTSSPARADKSTIKKNSPCALGARAPLDKLSVPLNNFFFHQYQHEHWNYQIINYSWMQIVPLLRKSLHRSWSSSQ